MRLLLDTHVLVWSMEQPQRLGPKTSAMLVSAAHENWICAISTLEIARLLESAAISLQTNLTHWLQLMLTQLDATTLEVGHEIAIESYSLPKTFHRDPADRILIAAARLHELALVTADEKILAYTDVKTIDARQ